MADIDWKRYLVQPGQKVRLEDWDAGSTPAWKGSKEEAEKPLLELNDELEALQELLFAEGKHKVLVVLQGMDTSGKDGVIRHVFEGVNPQGVRVASFKVPTAEELAHDYLWRVHQQTPGQGEIVIFNRSHYEDVLVVRVHNLVPAGALEAALRPDQRLRAPAGRGRHHHPQVLPAHRPGRAEASACWSGWMSPTSTGSSTPAT